MKTRDLPEALRRLPAALTSPAAFARRALPGYQTPPHILELNRALVTLLRTPGGRLLVEAPPRHGKSELCSRATPAYTLGTHPDWRILLTSYEASFAEGWGRKARDLLAEHAGLFRVALATAPAAARSWGLAPPHRGTMDTAGVGGPLTGKGADLLIVDDPVKSAEEAMSLTFREKTWEWWRATASTRLEPDGRVLLVMTRWHADDLAGRILTSPEADRWTVLHLPALSPSGEALWPERYPAEELARIRDRLGSYWFSALYQGTPGDAEGTVFRRAWMHYYDGAPPAHGRPWIAVDLAASTRAQADYTAIAVMARAGESLLLLDLDRRRLEGPDLLPAIRALASRWQASPIWIESAGFQLALVQETRRAGLPVRELRADRDKVSRALAVTPAFEAGRVLLPRRAPWLADLEAEMLAFPRAPHDDQVDALVHAITAGTFATPRAALPDPADLPALRDPLAQF